MSQVIEHSLILFCLFYHVILLNIEQFSYLFDDYSAVPIHYAKNWISSTQYYGGRWTFNDDKELLIPMEYLERESGSPSEKNVDFEPCMLVRIASLKHMDKKILFTYKVIACDSVDFQNYSMICERRICSKSPIDEAVEKFGYDQMKESFGG